MSSRLHLCSTLLLLALCGVFLQAEFMEADTAEPLVAKYLEATKAQQEFLRDATMDVKIEAEMPKWHKSASLQALRIVSKLGKITYDRLKPAGDKEVQKEVVARFLNLETHPPEGTQSYAISPANYKFKYKGLYDQNGRMVHVLQLTPKKKRENLFKGELWLDQTTYMPLHEEGKFVKSPLFVKSIEFSRDYEIKDGIAVPKNFHGKLDTRVVGPAQIAVDYTNFARGEPPAEETTAAPAPAVPAASPLKAQSQ